MKKILASLLALCMLCTLLPAAALAKGAAADYSVEILTEEFIHEQEHFEAHDASWYTETAVHARLLAMQDQFPEGMPWDNSDIYRNTYLWYGGSWDGVNVRFTGYGCVALALLMSDSAFGSDLPMWQVDNVSFSNVRVGDILRIYNDSHTVVVLSVNADSVTIVEGNYDGAILWGRTLSIEEVERADYILTRWPGVPQTPSIYTVYYDANGGEGAPEPQSKPRGQAVTLSDTRPFRDGQLFLGWAESADAAAAAYRPGDIFYRDADTTLYAVWSPPEWDPVAQYVRRSYSLILGREGDPDGITFWTSFLKNGYYAGSDIIHEFCRSAEFAARGLNAREIVTILYNTMLNRSPDEAGLAYWTEQLENGASPDTIISGFAGSAEFAGICAQYGISPRSSQDPEPEPSPDPDPNQDLLEAYIRRSYRLILGREGDPEGIQYWSDQFRSGAVAGAEIIHQFCASVEFQSRNLLGERIVEILYNTMLDRSPDAAGLAYWTEQLENGASPDAIISGFAGSDEFARICAQYGISP